MAQSMSDIALSLHINKIVMFYLIITIPKNHTPWAQLKLKENPATTVFGYFYSVIDDIDFELCLVYSK